MPSPPLRRGLAAAVCALCLGACEAAVTSASQQITGTAAPLKEPELPNTSKMLNCCNNLSGRSETASLVKDICPALAPKVTLVIDNYVKAKDAIKADKVTTDAAKTQALADLKSKSQGTLEPAARCLLTETVGKLGSLLTPKDCVADQTVGALPQGKQCADVTSAITDAK